MPNALLSPLSQQESQEYSNAFLGGMTIGAQAQQHRAAINAEIEQSYIKGEYAKHIQKLRDDAAMQRKILEEQSQNQRTAYTQTLSDLTSNLKNSEDTLLKLTDTGAWDSQTVAHANQALAGIQAARYKIAQAAPTGDASKVSQAAQDAYPTFIGQASPAKLAEDDAKEKTALMTSAYGGVTPNKLMDVTGHIPQVAADQSGNITGVTVYPPTQVVTNQNTVQGAMDRLNERTSNGFFGSKSGGRLSGDLSNHDRLQQEVLDAQSDVNDYYTKATSTDTGKLLIGTDPVYLQKNKVLNNKEAEYDKAKSQAALSWSQTLGGIQSNPRSAGIANILSEAQAQVNVPITDVSSRKQLGDVLYTMYDDAAKKYSAANTISAKTKLADVQNAITTLGYPLQKTSATVNNTYTPSIPSLNPFGLPLIK